MGDSDLVPREGNVNVTLGGDVPQPRRTFPCPLCGTDLELRQSRAQKPYCVCNACGVQLFFRGKSGIGRLRALLEKDIRLVGGPTAHAAAAVAAFSRLEQLREQKIALEKKRHFMLVDRDLENAISALDRDIARVQNVLGDMSGSSKS